MKKEMVVLTIALSIMVFLSGCSPKDSTGGVVESACNAPYFEYKATECCLDKNGNSICDSDEDIEESTTTEAATETETVTTTNTATTAEEVEITVADACSDTTYFECIASYITDQEVFFKLKTKRDGYTHLNKVSALGCSKEFTKKTKSSQGYPLRTNVIVSVPCAKTSPGDEFEDFDYVLDYTFYPISSIDSETGEYEGVERFSQSSTGKISGTTRSEPKKIL
jgi:hypothetical protein